MTCAVSQNMTPYCYYFLTETQTKHWLEKSEMVRFLEPYLTLVEQTLPNLNLP
jgi:hypothetical protein